MSTKHVILLAVLLCLMAIEARHFNEQPEKIEDELKKTNTGSDHTHHRRKRYHINYGYEYQPPANPYHPYRREYDRNPQQDYLPEILRLLDEISSYVRRPAPPPQPIYIPYAVPYPICNCGNTNQELTPKKQNPTITNRFPDMEPNQNWGFIKDDIPDEEGDGSRPLSFTPIRPKYPLSRPPVALEHGTQSGRVPTTQEPPPHVPAMCDVVSLSCCSGTPAQQKQCLINNGCSDVFDDGRGCNPERLLKIIEEYSKAYAPVN